MLQDSAIFVFLATVQPLSHVSGVDWLECYIVYEGLRFVVGVGFLQI